MADRKAYNAKYHAEHREQIAAQKKAWGERNKGYIREKQRQELARLKLQVLELLGGAKCVRCGFDDVRALQIDHINGDGSKDRHQYGKQFYLKILDGRRSKDDLQVLCANCNWIKRVENNEVRRAIQ